MPDEVAIAASGIEVAQLAVAALTPVLIVVLGYFVTQATKKVEQGQWATRKVVERKIELHKEMAPLINDLYCFFTLVGNFQNITPPDALVRKRDLDRIFHTNQQLFGPTFRKRYRDFIAACFDEYTGFAQDAKIKTPVTRQKQERRRWDPAWETMFADASTGEYGDIPKAHDQLMETFAAEVGAGAED